MYAFIIRTEAGLEAGMLSGNVKLAFFRAGFAAALVLLGLTSGGLSAQVAPPHLLPYIHSIAAGSGSGTA